MFFHLFKADDILARFFRWPLALGLCLVAGAAGAADPIPLRVNVFPGAQNLPLYIGLAQGIFEKHGLKVEPSVAEQTYDLLKEPKFGLSPDAKFDLEGFKHLLALRAEIEGQWGGTPPAPERYFDLGYYDRAMKQAGR